MTHNPFATGPISGRPWSDEDDMALLNGLKAGGQYVDLAKALRRTVHSVKSRSRMLNLSAEERRALNHLKRQSQPQTIKMRIDHGKYRPPPVPDAVMEDLIKRMTTPRSLTASLMGDPPFPATPNDPRVLA